jgi:hypothetical protein
MMKNVAFLFLIGSLLGLSGCRGDEGRCEDLCAAADDCEGANIDVDDCVEECVSDADGADDSCVEAFEAAADCASDQDLDCDDVTDECDDEVEDWVDDCEDDFEDTFAEIVGGGSTPTDCAGSNTCIDAFDGFCDEPEGTGICADGTDTSDCCF